MPIKNISRLEKKTHHIVSDSHPGALQYGNISRHSGVGALYVDVEAGAGGVVADRTGVPGGGTALHPRPVEGVVLDSLGTGSGQLAGN